MREKLDALTQEELETMAGEIVRNLTASRRAEASREAESAGTLLRSVLHAAREMQSASAATGESAAAAALPAVPHGAQARFASGIPETEAPVMPGAFPRAASRRREDAAALSEFFRRDSRRYDAGFERY